MKIKTERNHSYLEALGGVRMYPEPTIFERIPHIFKQRPVFGDHGPRPEGWRKNTEQQKLHVLSIDSYRDIHMRAIGIMPVGAEYRFDLATPSPNLHAGFCLNSLISVIRIVY